MSVLSGWGVAEVRRVLMVGLLSVMAASCSLPHVSDAIPQRGDMRPFEQPLPVNLAHNKLAIGWSTTVGVKEDGSVWSWGDALHGELGTGVKSAGRNEPGRIEGMSDFIEVAGTGQHFLALRRDGSVWSWGSNDDGQLGYVTEKNYSAKPQKIPGLENIISIAAGAGHSIALDKQGRVFTFGSNDNLQLGFMSQGNDKYISPRLVFEEKDAGKVMAYGATSLLLTREGDVYYWGADKFLQNSVKLVLPTKYHFMGPIVDVAISNSIFVLTADGFVWAQSGANDSGQLGQGNYKRYEEPVKVKNIGRIRSIAARIYSGIALDDRGVIWQWGDSVRFPTIHGFRASYEPLPVRIAKYSNATRITANSACAVLLDDGSVYFWGQNNGLRGTYKSNKNAQSSESEWSETEKSLWTWK